MNKTFYVYMLRCSDNSLYTGYTVNLEARLKKHFQGTASKYTRTRLPVSLVYFEKYNSKILAIRREYEIKQWSKIQKESLIQKK